MATAPPRGRGGFGGGFSRGRGPGRFQRQQQDPIQTWVPVTKLGRLVKSGKISSIEDVFIHSLTIKEVFIVDILLSKIEEGKRKSLLEENVFGIKSVQRQTCAGQRTRMKAIVGVGDRNGHVGLAIKCTKDAPASIRAAVAAAKLAIIPVRRGYWGNRIGSPHTVPLKVHGKCGSVRVRLIPAPSGSHIVGSKIIKVMLKFAGIKDCFVQSCGKTRTTINFCKAVYAALGETYKYLTPDLWPERPLLPPPAEEYAMELGAA